MDASPLSFDLSAALHEHGMSKRSFFRYWSMIFNVSPRQYMLRQRLESAARLLAEKELSVKDIAEQTGFFDTFHFSRTFKKRYGVSPSNYKRIP